jgi:hypothetical protein
VFPTIEFESVGWLRASDFRGLGNVTGFELAPYPEGSSLKVLTISTMVLPDGTELPPAGEPPSAGAYPGIGYGASLFSCMAYWHLIRGSF